MRRVALRLRATRPLERLASAHVARAAAAGLAAAALAVAGARDIGAARACVPAHPVAGDSAPAWSPDGRSLALTRIAAHGGMHVVTVRLADRRQRRLTVGSSPTWGPRGLAFVRGFTNPPRPPREVPCPTAANPEQTCFVHNSCEGLLPQWDLFTTTGAGGVRRRLTQTDMDERSPAWGPRGLRLAYVAASETDGPGIEILDLRTRTRRRVTAPANWDADPAWSPDGREIAFTRLIGEQTDLFAVDVHSGRERRITRTPQHGESEPTWSPDGRSIAFARDGVIVVARADGSRPYGIATGGDPSWSPRGSTIAFVRARRGATSIALVDLRTERVTPLLPR